MAGNKGVLRVGILCEGLSFQRWQAECIRHVMAVPGVEVVVLVEPEKPEVVELSFLQRMLRHPWRIDLYLRYRRKWFRPKAMEQVDLTEDLKEVPRISCAVTTKDHGQYFGPSDLERIRAHRPDVLLRFGFNILRGEILELPTLGVWSYHHGDEEHYRGGPPGVWEILHGSPVTGAVLQRLTDRLDGGHILRKGWFKTIDHSLEETVDTILTHSSIWVSQVLREMLKGNTDAANGTLSTTRAKIRRYPTNGVFLKLLSTMMRNKMSFHRSSIREHEEWNIGVLYGPIQGLLEEKANLNVRWLPAPSTGTYRADPFGHIDEKGQLHVLYEKFDHAQGKGEISRVRPKRDNVLKRSKTLLELTTHLSYPYIVHHEGEVYVIPENAASGEVAIYTLEPDLRALRKQVVLLKEGLFDPTLVEHEGRWWMFGTRSPLTNTELFLYYADDIFGPYTPHPLNPVKCDIRSARPGGTPFMHEGSLYRPAQDSSITYGGRIAINRIKIMDMDRFEEETVKFIGPIEGNPHNKGMHTISAVGDMTLVDGKRMIRLKEPSKSMKRQKIQRLFQRDRS